MNKYELWAIVILAVANIFLAKTVLISVGMGTLLIIIMIIAIYNEVKKLNTDDYRE